jgi:hypothetical protein
LSNQYIFNSNDNSVYYFSKPDKIKSVSIDDQGKYYCSCGFACSMGIPCRHILRKVVIEQAASIDKANFAKRWHSDVGAQKISNIISHCLELYAGETLAENDDEMPDKAKYLLLSNLSKQVNAKFASSVHYQDLVSWYNSMLLNEVHQISMPLCLLRPLPAMTAPAEDAVILDPPIAAHKGRTKKSTKTPKALSTTKNKDKNVAKKYCCAVCGESGHNSKTCGKEKD